MGGYIKKVINFESHKLCKLNGHTFFKAIKCEFHKYCEPEPHLKLSRILQEKVKNAYVLIKVIDISYIQKSQGEVTST